MTGATQDSITIERRAAQRLGRLFRVERGGGFERHPIATVERLVARRGTLVEELLRLDHARRAERRPLPAALRQAMGELKSEIEQSLAVAEARCEGLRAELRLLNGEGLPTGVRDNRSGRLIGRG